MIPLTKLILLLLIADISAEERVTKIENGASSIPSEGLTLSQLSDQILSHNPLLKAARKSIQASVGKKVQEGAYPNPEFEFEVEDMPTGNVGDLGKSINTFLLKQEFLTAGKRKAAMAAAGKEIEISTSEYASLERKILTAGKSAFYSLLAAQEKVAVSTRLVEIARKNAEASQLQVDAGDVSPVEAIRARVALSKAGVDLLTSKKEKANAAKELLLLMGSPNASLNSVGQAGELFQLSVVSDKEDALASVLENHPLLQGIARAGQLAELEQKIAEKDRWPNLEITLGVETAPLAGSGREQTFVLGIGIPLPIFNRNNGAIAEALANRKKAEYELQAGRQEVTTRFRQALRNYITARQNVESYAKEIVPGARKAFDLISRAYEAGEIGQLELLDAQQTLAESELEYVDALAELKAGQVELEALIGR